MQQPIEAPIVITKRYRNYALFVLTLVFTSSHVDRQIIGILLQPIKTDLGASDTQMGFLVGLTFAIFYATLGMPIAMLADRGNRRNIIAIAVTIWSAMTVACGFATSFFQLALTRIGVGIGEAGSNPPSHSLISDYFPIEQRSTAMAIFAVGVNLGLLFAYIGGGWMSQHLGWRTAFFVVGAPGLLIALIVRFTLIEPTRGAAEKTVQTNTTPPSFMTVARNMWATKSLRHVVAGGSLAAFVGYGMVLWLPAYFVRSHGLSQTEVGFTLAFLYGIIGGIGTFCSGVIADRMSARDARWNLWVVAIGMTIVVPLAVASFLVETTWIAIALFCIPAFCSGFYIGPGFSAIQSLAPVRMRSVSAAINLFLTNLIGLGIGPQLVGVLSDYFKADYGNESLRYSLMIFVCINLWAALHYVLANRYIREDLALAETR